MTAPRCQSATLFATVVVLASSVSTLALAQSQDASRTLANNDSLMIDGRTFKLTPGTAKGDVSAEITKLGARELGPGAIIFRNGDKLYIADSLPISPKALAMYDPRIDIDRQRSTQGLRDVDIERQRSTQGLRDVDIDRQRSTQGLRDVDIDRQRSTQGLRDVDIDRQRSTQGLRDADVPRQQARSGFDIDVDRQRSTQGLRDIDVERQRSTQGLRDADVARQQPNYMLDSAAERRIYINDPDYLYYRLKKAFDETWTTAENK
jgi:hypothetical protein